MKRTREVVTVVEDVFCDIHGTQGAEDVLATHSDVDIRIDGRSREGDLCEDCNAFLTILRDYVINAPLSPDPAPKPAPLKRRVSEPVSEPPAPEEPEFPLTRLQCPHDMLIQPADWAELAEHADKYHKRGPDGIAWLTFTPEGLMVKPSKAQLDSLRPAPMPVTTLSTVQRPALEEVYLKGKSLPLTALEAIDRYAFAMVTCTRCGSGPLRAGSRSMHATKKEKVSSRDIVWSMSGHPSIRFEGGEDHYRRIFNGDADAFADMIKERTVMSRVQVRCTVEDCDTPVQFTQRGIHLWEVHQMADPALVDWLSGAAWPEEPAECAVCTQVFPVESAVRYHQNWHRMHPDYPHTVEGLGEIIHASGKPIRGRTIELAAAPPDA